MGDEESRWDALSCPEAGWVPSVQKAQKLQSANTHRCFVKERQVKVFALAGNRACQYRKVEPCQTSA